MSIICIVNSLMQMYIRPARNEAARISHSIFDAINNVSRKGTTDIYTLHVTLHVVYLPVIVNCQQHQ